MQTRRIAAGRIGMRKTVMDMPPFYVMEVLERAQELERQGRSIIHLARAIREAGRDVKRMLEIFKKRRKLTIDRLRKTGFGVAVELKGALYVLANAKSFTDNSLKFAFELLEETGVGVTPGIDFGLNGEGYVRFSYANSIENVSTGMDRSRNISQVARHHERTNQHLEQTSF